MQTYKGHVPPRPMPLPPEQAAKQALLDGVGRLGTGQHLIGDQVCVIHATLGVDTLAVGDAPGRESVRVYVNTDNPDTISLLSLAAALGIPEPLIKGAMELVTIIKNGHQSLEVLPLEPHHADGLNLLGHVTPPVVDAAILADAAKIGPREYALIAILTRIVMETMAYPPCRPSSSDSFLPAEMVEDAQRCLGMYGLRIRSNTDMVVGGAA